MRHSRNLIDQKYNGLNLKSLKSMYLPLGYPMEICIEYKYPYNLMIS